jgi:hypothetical protein
MIKIGLGGLTERFKRKPKEERPKIAPRADWITRGVLWSADKLVLFACLAVIVAVYIVDVLFFMSVGGALWWVFLLIGLVFRSYAVGIGPVLQHLRGNVELRDTRRTLRSIQLFCFLACLYPPMNFFAASHFEKLAEAEAIGATASASTGTKEDRIDRLEKRLTDAAANRDAAIKAANDTAAIIKDQVVGTSTSDNQTLRELAQASAKAVTDYTTTSTEIQGKIDAIEDEKETVVTAAAKDKALNHDTWPVFIWLGEQFPLLGRDEAGVTHPGSHLIWANWSLFFFAMLIEFCALLSLGAYVRAHGFFQVMLDALSRKKADPDQPPVMTETPKPSDPAPAPVSPPEPPTAPDPKDPPLDLTTPAPAIDPDEARREHLRKIGQKGREAQEHAREAAKDIFRVPLDDWRDRARANGAMQ